MDAPSSMKRGLVAVAFVAISASVHAQIGTGFVVSTQPAPVQAGRGFQVMVSGIFRPNLAGDPRGPEVTINGGSITVALRRDCGFLCPTSQFEKVSFLVSPLVAGAYEMKIYQGSVAGSPDVQFAFAASPQCYQGLWWKSPGGSESGWGLSIDHQGDILFAVWFTYDASGNGMWLAMPRMERSGEATYTGPLYRTGGPAFDTAQWDASTVRAESVGVATLSFSDANNGTFSYSINGKAGSKSITRQVFSSPIASCVLVN